MKGDIIEKYHRAIGYEDYTTSESIIKSTPVNIVTDKQIDDVFIDTVEKIEKIEEIEKIDIILPPPPDEEIEEETAGGGPLPPSPGELLEQQLYLISLLESGEISNKDAIWLDASYNNGNLQPDAMAAYAYYLEFFNLEEEEADEAIEVIDGGDTIIVEEGDTIIIDSGETDTDIIVTTSPDGTVLIDGDILLDGEGNPLILDEGERVIVNGDGEVTILDEEGTAIGTVSGGGFSGGGSSFKPKKTSVPYLSPAPKGVKVAGYTYPYSLIGTAIAGGGVGAAIAYFMKKPRISYYIFIAAGLMLSSAIAFKYWPPKKEIENVTK